MENSLISFFTPPSDARTTLASSFPRFCSDGHYDRTMRAWTLMRMCEVHATCGCVVFAVCAFVRWSHTFQLFFLMLCSLLLLLCVSCHLYHTVTQAVKLSSLWHPRTVHQFGRACACYVSCGDKHIISREGLVQGPCQGSRAIQTHTYVLPRDLKSNRAATVTTAAAALQASGVSWQPRRVFTCMCAVFTRRHL